MSANAADIQAFVVIGQSGIGAPLLTPPSTEPNLQSGKSVFLIWLLMRRLVLGLPTVLQIQKCSAVLFRECGVSKFLCLDSVTVHHKLTFPRSSLSRIG